MGRKAQLKKKKMSVSLRNNKAIETLIETSTKKFKRQVLYRATEAPQRVKYSIPFTSLVLNRLTGGGAKVPRMLQIYGPPSVYKSTGTLDLIASVQEMGQTAVLFDTENSFDSLYASRLGVDIDNLLLGDPVASGDELIEHILDLMRGENPPALCVLDSLTGVLTDREIATSIQDQIKLQGWIGKFNSQIFRHLNNANQGGTAFVFVNQERDTMGEALKSLKTKRPKKPTGGNAPAYFSSDILFMEKEAPDLSEYEDIPVGQAKRSRRRLQGWMVAASLMKSKTTPNEGMELFYYMRPDRNGIGRIDHIGEIIDLAKIDGLFEMKGSYFWVNGERIANGYENLRATLKQSKKNTEAMIDEDDEDFRQEPYYILRSKIERKTAILGGQLE